MTWRNGGRSTETEAPAAAARRPRNRNAACEPLLVSVEPVSTTPLPPEPRTPVVVSPDLRVAVILA